MTARTHVLVPLDGSELAKDALTLARSLVGSSGQVTLLQVARHSAPLRDAAGVEIVPEEIVGEWILKEARENLSDVARTFSDTVAPGVDVVTHVVSGDPAGAILLAAEEYRADFIVMTSHARGAVGRAAFGSVTDRVARTATIPVIITRPELGDRTKAYPGVRRIIVPRDRSNRSNEALPVAKAMAQNLDSSIHLVHVIDTFSSYMAVTGAPISQPLLDEWYADSRHDLETAAADLIAAGIETTWAVYQGSTVANLCEIAEQSDLIVMTSHGRSGFTRWLIGSIAEKLVRTAPVPVCLVPARHEAPAEAFAPFTNLQALEI
ncbi:hypothetical protein BH09CHL1_BH09CHL1_30440 [soil metagenome]